MPTTRQPFSFPFQSTETQNIPFLLRSRDKMNKKKEMRSSSVQDADTLQVSALSHDSETQLQADRYPWLRHWKAETRVLTS